MPNHLVLETSPYLLQHANNPVDWYAWGKEAFSRAIKEDKPVFLSIGYAACHWCHVMAHESFEDPYIATFLNDHFVCIKVDREERPDIDDIYLNAVVTMTGQGGWPLSVFLTPEGQPFYGGTYFPPIRKYGMSSFLEILGSITRIWNEKKQDAIQAGENITRRLREKMIEESLIITFQSSHKELTKVADYLVDAYDLEHGGWGGPPKFPQPMVIDFLLGQATRKIHRYEKYLEVATHTLDLMRHGGLFDILGGGFHRYSTDATWTVPHFEKMLYDNAQLASAYLHAFMLTGKMIYRQTCEKTLDFIRREMAHPEGGFFSSLDADSDGKEGIYYLWDNSEIKDILNNPADYELFCRVYNLSTEGNFEGKNILQQRVDDEALAGQMGQTPNEIRSRLEAIHELLFQIRSRRTRPQTDDKVLVSWNALTLQAFTEAGQYLDRPGYLDIARSNAKFIITQMHSSKYLWHSWREGQTRQPAFLEDYAALILALLSLYQADFNLYWYTTAVQLVEEMIDSFYEPDTGFYDTRIEHGATILRPRQLRDSATPSGNALATMALLRLSKFNQVDKWQEIAEKTLGIAEVTITRNPLAHGYWLTALDFALGPVQQVAIMWPHQENECSIPAPAHDFLDYIRKSFRPRTITAASEIPVTNDAPSLLSIHPGKIEQTTAFICEGFFCKQPVTTMHGFVQNLNEPLITLGRSI